MTAQLSRERLEEIAALEIKITDDGTRYSPKAHGKVYSHEIVTMARMLLAGMSSEPSGYLYRGYQDTVETPWRYTKTLPDYVAGDAWQIRPQFDISAPPVISDAVIDRIVIPLNPDGLNEEEHHCEWHLYHDRERIRKSLRDYFLAPPAPVAVPDEIEMDDDFDSAFEHGKAVGWNACRTAMQSFGNSEQLKAEPVTAATVPDEISETW